MYNTQINKVVEGVNDDDDDGEEEEEKADHDGQR